jgi:hypothetical protein
MSDLRAETPIAKSKQIKIKQTHDLQFAIDKRNDRDKRKTKSGKIQFIE